MGMRITYHQVNILLVSSFFITYLYEKTSINLLTKLKIPIIVKRNYNLQFFVSSSTYTTISVTYTIPEINKLQASWRASWCLHIRKISHLAQLPASLRVHNDICIHRRAVDGADPRPRLANLQHSFYFHQTGPQKPYKIAIF